MRVCWANEYVCFRSRIFLSSVLLLDDGIFVREIIERYRAIDTSITQNIFDSFKSFVDSLA